MAILDLQKFKDQVRVVHSEEDATLERMLEDAELIVLNYVTDVGSPAWDVDTLPTQVRAAILEVATNLWRHRGDDGEKPGPLTQRAKDMLRPYRDLPIA